jgi:succinyl-diaminopimelate desuccinylase
MQQNLETTLAKLVSIPSVSTSSSACHEIIDYIRNELEPLGLYVTSHVDQPNPWFIATTKKTTRPDVVLAAHLDVVPGSPDLFSMQKTEDGKLHGRGVYDMKFAAACYIEFAKAHAEILRTLNIGFLFTTDEEIGGDTSIPVFIDTGWRPRRVLLPDGGEPWSIERRAKGLFGMKLTATGRSAHGSVPWEGKNAIHTLMDIAEILRREYPSDTPTGATLAFTMMNGGKAANQISDHATVMLDFRAFDKGDLARFKTRITELSNARGVSLEIPYQGAPVSFDDSTPEVQDFLAALRKVTKNEPLYEDSFGGSDARYFAAQDIPTIIIEPEGGGRHAPDEWILATDLEKYCLLLEYWLIPENN